MRQYCTHYATIDTCNMQPSGGSDVERIVFQCPDQPAVDCASLASDGLPCGDAAGGAVCANCCSVDGVCGSDQGSCNRQQGAHPLYSASGFVDINMYGTRKTFPDLACAPSPSPPSPPPPPPRPIDCASLLSDGDQCGAGVADDGGDAMCRHCCSSTGFCGTDDGDGLWCGAGNQPEYSYAKLDPGGSLCSIGLDLAPGLASRVEVATPPPPSSPPPHVCWEEPQCVTLPLVEGVVPSVRPIDADGQSNGGGTCVTLPCGSSLSDSDIRRRLNRLHAPRDR